MLVSNVSDLIEYSRIHFEEEDFLFTKTDGSYKGVSRGKTIEDIKRVADRLIREGYENKKILLIGENSYEWAVTYMAIVAYVGVAVLADKDYTLNDYRNIFGTVDDIALVIYTDLRKEVIGELRNTKFAGEEAKITYYCLQTDIRDYLKQTDEREEFAHGVWKEKPAEEMCEIVFTSGTTAKPKAIMLSQKNILVNLKNLLRRTPMNVSDRLCLVLPLHHLYAGVHAYLYSYYTGMKIYLCNNMGEMIEDMQTTKPTVFVGVPIIYDRIAKALDGKNLFTAMGGELKYVFCGGAKLDEGLKRLYLENGIELLDAYGVSEMSSVISFSYPGEAFNLSQGTVFENQKVVIKDPDAEGFGEILVTGENRMLGYYRNEEATKAKIDENGFLHTGDIGRLDEKNRLYIRGRMDRMFATANGKNIYPEEIEKLFLESGLVSRVKVYLEKSRLHALLVSDEEEDVLRELLQKVNDKLPYYKNVKEIEIEKTNARTYLK